MIKKILKLKNVGLYALNPLATCKNWNGEFKKNTIIYGENGTGKTTLSLLLASLKGDNEILRQKSTIGTDGVQEVVIRSQDNMEYIYKNGSWQNHFTDIEIFDIHFIEDNVYIGSSLLDSNQVNLFDIVVGQKGLEKQEELKESYEIKKDWNKMKEVLKARLSSESDLSDEVIKDINKQIEYLNFEIRFRTNHIKQLQLELGEYSKSVFDKDIQLINKYLKKFTPHIQLEKFSKKHAGEKQFVSYSLSVNGEIVDFERKRSARKRSFKYSLSEGDKSAFALAFFLAQLEKIDLKDKIIVFDDPLSSFDQSRRHKTTSQLVRISERCKQLFVFTHHIDFAKMLSRKLEKASTVSLKIQKKSNQSIIMLHDIEAETLGDLFKDITVLNDYMSNGVKNELEKREVIRCIRPTIEGIMRIKFFKEIKHDEWLGDMIKKIREASEQDRLYRLQSFLDEIADVNDYSKEFHHCDPTEPSDNIISDEELRSYVGQTLRLIDKI
jgi:wobble nucleotide-excising tRNase